MLVEVEATLAPPGPLVIDLTGVEFLASTGLSALVSHNQRYRDLGVELRVVTGNRTVARTIKMTGLTGELSVFDTLVDALTPLT